MADIEINVSVVGADSASSDIKEFGDSVQTAGDNAKTAGSSFQSVGSKLSDFKSNLAGVVGSFTALGTSILDIVRNFTSLEQASIRVDTANKRVQQSAIQVEAAQRKYNDAVATYGKNSKEAATAAEKLEVATKNHEIAVDRAHLTQQRFNEQLAELATNIVPSVIGVFGSIVSIIGNFTQKGEAGVSLLGKLKQSFLDLVSGGSNVGNTMNSAGNAMSGLGTKAGTAGTAASGLKNEVVQLGTGITQAIPNIGQFGGGLTNTAAAAERTAGPLGNVERAVASVAPAAAGAAGPLGTFGGAMGEAGAVSVEAAGSLEAAAVSTGALETGSAAAAAETVGLAAGIGGVSVATAAMTAGVSLAVAALVLYVFNIGGVKDKTDAAVGSAQKFLAIGWEGFAKKFEPVTKAINDALDALGKLLHLQETASGQFGPQPAPGKSLAPGGTQGTLDDIIKTRSKATVNPEAALSPIGAAIFGGAVVPAETLQSLDDYTKKVQSATVATEPLKTGVRGANENFKQMEADTKAASAGLQQATTSAQSAAQAAQKHAEAVKAAAEAERQRQQAVTASFSAMQQVTQITQQASQEAEKYKDLLVSSAASGTAYQSTLNSLSEAFGKNDGTIRANNEILTSYTKTQELAATGAQQQVIALQNQEMALVKSQAALQVYDQQLQTGIPQQTAFNQGIVDFNTKLNDLIVAANHAAGEFQAFITNVQTGKDQLANLAKGFTDGLADVQKWAEGITQAKGEVVGIHEGLVAFAQVTGIDLPKGLALSNDQLKTWIGLLAGSPAELQKVSDAASKAFGIVVDEWKKVAASVNPQELSKNIQDVFKDQIEKFGGLLPGITNKVANEMAVMERALQSGIDRAGAILTGAKLTVGPINTQQIALAKNELQLMVNFLDNQFARGLSDLSPKFKPVIDQIGQMVAKSQGVDQLEKSIGLFNVVMAAAKNPTDAQAQALAAQQLAASGLQLVLDPVTQSYKLVATNSQSAAGGVQKLSDGMKAAIDLNTGFARGVDDAVGSLNKLEAAGTTAFSHFAPALANVAAMFNQAFARGVDDAIGALNKLEQAGATAFTHFGPALEAVAAAFNTAFARASSDAIGSINTMVTNIAQSLSGFGPALEGIVTAFNQAFARASSDAIGSMNTLVSNVASALSGFGPALQGIVVAFNQAFAQASSDAIGSMNTLVSNVASALSGFGPALQGITVAFNQAFAQAASDAIGSINNMVSQIATSLSGFGPALQGITVAFNQAFATAAQDAAGSVNNLAQQVQTDIQNMSSAVNAISSVFNTAFQKGAQDAAGSVNQLTSNVQTSIQQISQTVNQVAQQMGQAFQQAGQTASTAMQQLGQSIQQAAQTGQQAFNSLRTALQQFIQLAQQPIVVRVDTTAAQQQIASLRQQLASLQGAMGAPQQQPQFFASQGGQFKLGLGGFEQLHAAKGGSFIVTKQTQLSNLTVGENNKPEMVTFAPGRHGRGIGLVTVVPLPKFHAQSGGVFGVGGSPNLSSPQGLFGFTAGAPAAEPGAVIDYGAGLPVPVQGQGGVPVTQLGQYGTPSFGTAPGPGLFPGMGFPTGAPAAEPGAPIEYGAGGSGAGTGTGGTPTGFGTTATGMGTGTGTTGGAGRMTTLAHSILIGMQDGILSNQQTQNDVDDLIKMIKALVTAIIARNASMNLIVDGQKMASVVSKWLNAGAYGGR